VPEGDTLFRVAAALRPYLVGRTVNAATATRPGPRAELLVDRTIESVEARGKNLLIVFEGGLELRTHLGMHGSWHRYAPGEPWRRPAARARIALEVPGAVAVCFDAPTAELFEARAEAVHPVLSTLGPDLLDPGFGENEPAEAVRRLRATAAERPTIAEALLDQRAVAGIGNVYRSEVLFMERVDPFAAVADLADDTLRGLILRARELLGANLGGWARTTTTRRAAEAARSGRLWVYGRAGRPCRRCGGPVATRRLGEYARNVYWCPACQAGGSRRGPPGL
jgi:endonuclease VIII